MATLIPSRTVLSTRLNENIMSTGEIAHRFGELLGIVGDKADDRAKRQYAVSNSLVSEIQGAAFGDGVAVVGVEDASGASLYYSDDGFASLKRTEIENVPAKSFKAIAYAPDKHVFVAAAELADSSRQIHLYASTTGKAWTEVCSYFTNKVRRIEYDRDLGLFVVGCSTDPSGETTADRRYLFGYSEDGYLWNLVRAPEGVAAGHYSNVVKVSHDGGKSVFALIPDEPRPGQVGYVELELARTSAGLEFEARNGGAVAADAFFGTSYANFVLGGEVYACGGAPFVVDKLTAEGVVRVGDLPRQSGGRCAVTVGESVYVGLRYGGIARMSVATGAFTIEDWIGADAFDAERPTAVEALIPQNDGTMIALGRARSDEGLGTARIWRVGFADKSVTPVEFANMEIAVGGAGGIPDALTQMMAKYRDMTNAEKVVTTGSDADDMERLAAKLNRLIENFNAIADLFKA